MYRRTLYAFILFDHDVLNLFSDLFSDNNQNLSFFSEFIFNSHYMFRRSGPGHMLLHTVPVQLQVSYDGSRLVFHGSMSVFIGF